MVYVLYHDWSLYEFTRLETTPSLQIKRDYHLLVQRDDIWDLYEIVKKKINGETVFQTFTTYLGYTYDDGNEYLEKHHHNTNAAAAQLLNDFDEKYTDKLYKYSTLINTMEILGLNVTIQQLGLENLKIVAFHTQHPSQLN